MSALRNERLLKEALGDRDDLPGVEGILVAAIVVAALLAALLFMG
jgi:hypothetical protein